jgi:hypothetical protein
MSFMQESLPAGHVVLRSQYTIRLRRPEIASFSAWIEDSRAGSLFVGFGCGVLAISVWTNEN